MDWITTADGWAAFATLTALEIVLGIDNIIFISILSGKLPEAQQPRAQKIGLMLALGTRILLLLSLAWIMQLEADLFTILGHGISGRDLIMLSGGLFLLFKATREVHEAMEHLDKGETRVKGEVTYRGVLFQIMLLDIVFSLDSVITAVGMADNISIMVSAVVVAVGVMLVAAAPIAKFVEGNPTVKMLALSFLLLIGVTLIADGMGFHIPKGYIYFAIAFSVFVEMLNLRAARKT
ncbi:MAG: putative tellurium resistance membrane protein TerC [Myxococcota bacterium]